MMASDVLDHVDVLSNSVASLQTLFDCPICLDMLKDPVRTTSCGHTFCRMCIKKVLRRLTKEPCPICKTLLSNRNIVEDDKMSVFLGLVIELISSINLDIGYDVTTYYAKPISSYEASLNSEEFLNMKSNVVTHKTYNDAEQLITPKIPVTKTLSSNSEQNVGAFKENIETSKNKIADYLKSSPSPVDKQSKIESKVLISVQKLSVPGNTRQNSVLTSKENMEDQKTEKEKASEFTFLKPKPTKNLLKRKHTSCNDDDIGNTHEYISKAVAAKEGDEDSQKKMEGNKTKKMKVNFEEEQKKLKIEDEKKKRKMKIISEKKNGVKMKLDVSESSHSSLDSGKNIRKPSESSHILQNKKSCISNPDEKKSTLKKTVNSLVQSKMGKPVKSIAARPKKIAQHSTFTPKRLNNKTSKFYFITSLVMKRDGKKPLSIMKRTYPVQTKTNSNNSDGLTCSNNTTESSNQVFSSITSKSYTSVSVQTSPIKVEVRQKDPSEKKEKVGNSINIDEKQVNSDCLEFPRRLKLKNISIICEEETEKDCAMGPSDESNPGSGFPTNNGSQEDMDIFEPPDAQLHASKKMKMNLDQTVQELNDDDSELTQVNPNIQNRHNICTKKTVTPKSAQKSLLLLASGKKSCITPRNEIVGKRNDATTPRNTNIKNKEMEETLKNRTPDIGETNNGSVLNKSKVGRSLLHTLDGSSSIRQSPQRQKSTIDESRHKSTVDKTPSHRQKRKINQNSDKSFSTIDSYTSPSISKTNAKHRSPFLSYKNKNQILSTGENQSSEDVEASCVAEQLTNIQMACRNKILNHEVVNTDQTDSKVDEESSLNKSKVNESTRRIKPVADDNLPIDYLCTPRLTGTSMRNSQCKNNSQLNNAFCGSTLSEPLDSQQVMNTMECVRLEAEYAMENENRTETGSQNIDQMAVATEQLEAEKNLVIDGSDDEIPETPTKNPTSEILTQQLNNSKLEKSMTESQKSIIPSSLEITQISSSPIARHKLSKSPKIQKQKASNGTVAELFKKPEEKKVTLKNPKYSFVYSRLAARLLEMLEMFAHKVDAKITDNITEDTTHVIIVPDGNRAAHTFKYLKGVAKRLWVVSIEWVTSSLEANTVLPEDDFVPLDLSGEPGPWRCKHTDAQPLANFVVVPKPPFDLIKDEQVKELIVLCGGKVVDNIQSLGKLQPNTPHVLLTDEDMDVETFERYLEVDLVVPLHLSWLLASIGRFKPAPLGSHLPFPIKNIAEILVSLGVSDELIIDESDSEEEDD